MAKAGLLESSLLLLAIAASWVSVAQLARAAEVDTLQLQHHSVVPLVTWANATAWMVLALPHMVRRKQDHATGCQLLETTAFQAWHPPRFLFIALTTNFSYIGALHYLPASLNTAIFSSNPVFTLLLQSVFLSEGTKKTERFPSKVWSSLWTGKARQRRGAVTGIVDRKRTRTLSPNQQDPGRRLFALRRLGHLDLPGLLQTGLR
ncbi:unnamed protein product [Durusdinium trenchii]|uniref:EamA domain-containing protein n=1 Tax=Durusdinium trenchii TaxID=1381693 RepID=A0ABP0SYR2_9DINO